jgi:MraZ protein
MAVFLSSYLNKVDKKGRVSVPAQFRTVLAEQSLKGSATGLVVFRSLKFSALEACSPEHMEKLAADLEQMDISPDERELYEMTIFGDSVQLQIDGDGRVLLPQNLLEYARITEQASFVGVRKTFQIWEPSAYEARVEEARAQSLASGISLSSIAPARRPATVLSIVPSKD